jgi:addiction module RelB/DinJ family antitoxin
MEVFNMAKLEINIDDTTLLEAEKILHSLGMNTEMAINIFLKRVTLEKGMPMKMEAAEDFEDSSESSEKESRSNKRITSDMVEEVWNAFLRYLKGSGEISDLSTEIHKKTGMSRGSALIYLNILANLEKGEPNTRVMKMNDLKYYMGKIKNELGDSKHQNALNSLRASVPYWEEKLQGNFAQKVQTYCDSVK